MDNRISHWLPQMNDLHSHLSTWLSTTHSPPRSGSLCVDGRRRAYVVVGSILYKNYASTWLTIDEDSVVVLDSISSAVLEPKSQLLAGLGKTSELGTVFVHNPNQYYDWEHDRIQAKKEFPID